MDRKLKYDKFKEKSETYVMKQFNGGKHVIEGIKDTTNNVITDFDIRYKPSELTMEQMKSDV